VPAVAQCDQRDDFVDKLPHVIPPSLLDVRSPWLMSQAARRMAK